MIHPTAVIGDPPEQRGHQGPGVAPFIAPSARVEALVTVDAGTKQATYIGSDVWLMKKVHVGHDATVLARTEIAPGTVIGGWAFIGQDVKIGMNATVLPYRQIGTGAHVGAGAVVTRDIPAGETWAGNPARKLEDHERDPRPHTQRGGARLHA